VEWQRRLRSFSLSAGGVALAVVLMLLLSDRRVLVWETRVDPGQTYFVGEWGELGKASQSQLVCRYFTGRTIRTTVLWYSPNNILGRDECPFLVQSE
jgi:hypothetical protein